VAKLAIYVTNCHAWVDRSHFGAATAIYSAAWARMLDRYSEQLPCSFSFVHIDPVSDPIMAASAGRYPVTLYKSEKLALFVDLQRILWQKTEEARSLGCTHFGWFHADSFPDHECLSKICKKLDSDPLIDLMYPLNDRRGYMVNGVLASRGPCLPWKLTPPGASSLIVRLEFLEKSLELYSSHPLLQKRHPSECPFETRMLSHFQCYEYLKQKPLDDIKDGDVLVHGAIETDLWTVMNGMDARVCVITDFDKLPLSMKHAGLYTLGQQAYDVITGLKSYHEMRSLSEEIPASINDALEAPYFHLADSPSVDIFMYPELYALNERDYFAQLGMIGRDPKWIAYIAIIRLLARSLSPKMGADLDSGIKRLREMTRGPQDWSVEEVSSFEEKAMNFFLPALKDFLVADTVDGVICENDRLRIWKDVSP